MIKLTKLLFHFPTILPSVLIYNENKDAQFSNNLSAILTHCHIKKYFQHLTKKKSFAKDPNNNTASSERR